MGFNEEQSLLLKSKIIKNGGKATILEGNGELKELPNSESRTSLILTTRANFLKLKPYFSYISYPIVDLDWIEDSFKEKLCKYPFDYAFNQEQIFHREPIEHFSKMKKKLDLQLNTQPIEKFQPKILENTFIYLT